MEDIIQKYKKEKKTKTILIIVTSLFLALGLNFLVSNTEGGKYLASSVLNNQIAGEKQADLYLETVKNSLNNIIKLKASSQISQAKSISFSIAYNKDNVQIQNKILNIDQAELINVIENEGFNTIIINFEHPTNIKSAEEILNIVLEKQDINTLESINLINANITDNEGNIFSLSTSGIEF